MRGNGITITILGSGTCVPSLKRSSCSVSAKINGVSLLFDIGAGTIRRLLEADIPVFEIPYLFLSHFHPDHSGELSSFLFSRRFGNFSSPPAPLTIIGGKGLTHFFTGLKTVFGHWIELDEASPGCLELIHKKCDTIQFEGFKATSIPMEHNEESMAFRVTDESGTSFVYSGDTGYSENLIELSRNTDVLICEASFPEGHEVIGHLTPSQAGLIAQKAKVRKLILTHFYPECEATDIEKQCRKTYHGPLILAEDLMEIHLGKE